MISTTTFNPAVQDASTVLSNGNLTVTFYSAGYTLDPVTTPAITTGKHYCEMTLPARAGGTEQVIYLYIFVEDAAAEIAYTYSDYHLGGVIGMYFDLDSKLLGYIRPDGTLTATRTGTWTTGANVVVSAYCYPESDSQPPAGWVATFNFGATAFTHTPPPGYITAPDSASASLSLPRLTFYSPPNASGAINLPKLSAVLFSGVDTLLALPALRASSAGHDSTGEQAAEITLPRLTTSITTGANAKATLPSLSATAAGTNTILARADISMPSLSSSATGRVSGMSSIDAALPRLTASAYSGAVCSVTVGKLTAVSTGITGAVGDAQITLPLFVGIATATKTATATAAITLPSLNMGATTRAAVPLPSLSLVAVGTAVVAVSYEAYAVNLGHRPRVTNAEIPINEVTHYTNFPFTHVVRYQNSYYGANSTGLYLLEGTTDNGTAIPWAVKTAMDDFKTPVKKTVASAYFGGRFGPASTVQLHAGEQAANTYNFSTPRDALAQNHRQVFGKGVRERYYALGASGTGVVELDGVELDVRETSRRI